MASQSPIGKNEEIPGNTSGRTDNKGMEGLAITPDGKTLVGILQAPTVQDGNKSNLLRIVTAGSGVSDIVALNSHQFIVDERDGAGVVPSKIEGLAFGADVTSATTMISHLIRPARTYSSSLG